MGETTSWGGLKKGILENLKERGEIINRREIIKGECQGLNLASANSGIQRKKKENQWPKGD